ncbi:MAG: hypothetical protein ACRC0S_08020 [Fusobacteriaceae bacterium]
MLNICDGSLIKLNVSINEKTIVRIFYDDVSQKIKELEFLKIIGETKKTLKLSNGITVSKGCLFPYHHTKNFHRGEEYYILEKFII